MILPSESIVTVGFPSEAGLAFAIAVLTASWSSSDNCCLLLTIILSDGIFTTTVSATVFLATKSVNLVAGLPSWKVTGVSPLSSTMLVISIPLNLVFGFAALIASQTLDFSNGVRLETLSTLTLLGTLITASGAEIVVVIVLVTSLVVT